MRDRFDRLRHDTVISRHDEDHDVGNSRTTRTHERERLVTRRIEECDLSVVLHLDLICADVLRYAAGLLLRHACFPDRVQQ